MLSTDKLTNQKHNLLCQGGNYVITSLTAHRMCGLMSDLVICKFSEVWSCMTRNSLLRPGVIKQPKPKPFMMLSSLLGSHILIINIFCYVLIRML